VTAAEKRRKTDTQTRACRRT